MLLDMGPVGADRFPIVLWMLVLAKELHLDYQDLGYITDAGSVRGSKAANILPRWSARLHP
jgi:hypothetical protein